MKLSRRFYETLGDDVANELVEWFNQVDATYRLDLRELNETNFARFDAKLEQRLAEVSAELRVEMHAGFTRLQAAIAEAKGDLIRWMFVVWAGTSVTTVGLVITIVKLF
ncbi:MAG: hypothetical protein ACREMR_06860 [Gemmatimonadales bacterium]